MPVTTNIPTDEFLIGSTQLFGENSNKTDIFIDQWENDNIFAKSFIIQIQGKYADPQVSLTKSLLSERRKDSEIENKKYFEK